MSIDFLSMIQPPDPNRRTSAKEWLAQMKMFLPFATALLGTGGPPLILESPGHVSIIFKNDLGETMRVDYDDGTKCDALEDEFGPEG